MSRESLSSNNDRDMSIDLLQWYGCSDIEIQDISSRPTLIAVFSRHIAAKIARFPALARRSIIEV
jgi:hypothetical protein